MRSSVAVQAEYDELLDDSEDEDGDDDRRNQRRKAGKAFQSVKSLSCFENRDFERRANALCPQIPIISVAVGVDTHRLVDEEMSIMTHKSTAEQYCLLAKE